MAMNMLRLIPALTLLILLASCQKKECDCPAPPPVDAESDTWILDGVAYKAKGHALKSRDGNAYLYTFVADTPVLNPSTLTLRFNAAPDNTNTFSVTAPSYTRDSTAAYITAYRGHDSTTFTSLGMGQYLSAYLNDAFELTWVVNGIWLKSAKDTVRLSLNLSE
jgi:hypothetical protein